MAIVTFNSTTINNVLIHKNQLSATDLAKLNANPQLMGKLALETLGATKTIPELDMELDQGASADSYYMCSEKSGAYLVDSRVAYGTTIVTNGTFDADTDWTKGTGWTIAAGVASCDGTQVADSLLTTSTIPVTVASSTYLVSFEVTAYTAGNVALQFDGVEIIPDKAAVGTYYTIATASDTTGTIDIVADLNFVGSVDNVTAQLISSIPIANYTETIRTNADLQQKGIQQTAFVTDGAGVPTAYSSNLLQFDDVSEKTIIPNVAINNNVTIEFVYAQDDGQIYNYNKLLGYRIDASNYMEIARLATGDSIYPVIQQTSGLTANAGSISISSSLSHVIYVIDFTNQQVVRYLNGVVVGTPVALTGTDAFVGTASLYLNGYSTATNRGICGDLGGFKIHQNKAFTATEVATAYAQAKLIYPTLP